MDGLGEGSKAGDVGGWENKQYKCSLMTGTLLASLMHATMLRVGKWMWG